MTTEEAAAKVAEFLRLQSDHLILPGGMPSVDATIRYVQIIDEMPEAVVALVREARYFAAQGTYALGQKQRARAESFLTATAPIVVEQKESGHAE